jgi:biotin carboxyl carrier protein
MARDKAERPDDTQTEQPHLSVAELRQLIKLMSASDLEEIGIEEAGSGLRLSLRKPAPVVVASGSEEEFYDALVVEETVSSDESTGIVVTAPLVGLFRSGMSINAKPLTAVGDVIREGQIVCAVESLTLFTEVEAPAEGRVSAILVREGQPVEYGQPLIEIQPIR